MSVQSRTEPSRLEHGSWAESRTEACHAELSKLEQRQGKTERRAELCKLEHREGREEARREELSELEQRAGSRQVELSKLEQNLGE